MRHVFCFRYIRIRDRFYDCSITIYSSTYFLILTPVRANELRGVQYNVKKDKMLLAQLEEKQEGYRPIFLCFTDKIKKGNLRRKKLKHVAQKT